MITDSGLAASRTIEHILEISADAKIQRRRVARDSAAYLALTNEITACSIALEFLCHQEPQQAQQPQKTPNWQLAPVPPRALQAVSSSSAR